MKTALDLDRDLFERAKEALGARSFTEAVETALREAVARSDARRAWDALMGSELSWKRVEELLAYRRRHGARAL